MNANVIIYCRVSSDEQTLGASLDIQEERLRKYCNQMGYTKSDEAMREEYGEEIRLLKRGYSLRNTSKLTGTSINTLRKLTKLT